MRRANVKGALSPQQLQELVSMVVSFVAVFAIVVGTIHWDSTEEHKENLAAEQAARDEAARQQAAKLEAARAKKRVNFAGESSQVYSGGDFGGGGGGSLPPPIAARSTGAMRHDFDLELDPRMMPTKPGQSVTIKGVPSDQAPGIRKGSRKSDKKTRIQNGAVSTEEKTSIQSVSRERTSGSSFSGTTRD